VEKKKWGKPKLIVLVKGAKEEMVLLACKEGNTGSGPGSLESRCLSNFGPCSANCSSTSPS